MRNAVLMDKNKRVMVSNPFVSNEQAVGNIN